MSETLKKYRIDTEENRAFLKTLTKDLLNFGSRVASPGGSSYYLKADGSPWKEHARETYITSRMVHVYTLGHFLGHEGSEAIIDAGLAGLAGELQDQKNGGWYPGITAEGKPLPDKLCYAHCFVILAASSALLAKRPGAKALLENALEVFDRFFWQEEEGMTVDTWNTEFTVLDDYRGLNANMHTVEAFLAAADATGEERYRERAGRIISRVVGWAGANDWRIPEHYTSAWEPDLDCNQDRPDDPFKPFGATPGHGIEWARLIAQWAVSAFPEGDPEAARFFEASKNLYGRAIADAWDADGAPGLVYTTDWEGRPVVHDRMHWVLAEAINTSAVLWRLTGEERYAKDFAMFLRYLDEKVLDKVNGSWFHQLDQKNELIGTVWPGKPDLYHAIQATLIPYHSVGVSIAKDLCAE